MLMNESCFSEYKKQNGRIITSSVFSDTTDEFWYQSALLIPHEAIRRDLLQVNSLLKNDVKAEEPWKLVTFFSWYENRFEPLIHHHHHAEEEIVFPVYSKKVRIPEKTSADHVQLVKLLDDLSNISKLFTKKKGDAHKVAVARIILPKLVEKWNELVILMLPHLKEEEEQMATIIKDNVTEQEHNAAVQEILKSSGLGMSRKLLPSIIEALEMWGSEKNKKEFMSELPVPIRILYRNFWSSNYKKYHRGALQSLAKGAPKQVIVEKRWMMF